MEITNRLLRNSYSAKMTSIDNTTPFGRSWISVVSRRLRGALQQKESSSTGAAIESKPQHHQYFGNEYLPSYIHMNTTRLVQPKPMNKAKSSNELLNEALASIPKSSLATLNPLHLSENKIMSTDTVLSPYAVAERKKKTKAKKHQFESNAPSIGPHENIKIPPSVPTMIPTSRSKSDGAPTLIITPSMPPSVYIEAVRSGIDPSVASESLSKEERTATGIVTTSAIVIISLALIAVLKRNKKRHKSCKSSSPDPALCENASISSERSSTFRDDDEKKAIDSSFDSSITSKINTPQEFKTSPTHSNVRKQNNVAMHVMKLINASVEYTKGNLTAERDSKNEESESFPHLSPYLVDEFQTNTSSRNTTSISILNRSKESSNFVHPKTSYVYSENEGETLLEESDRLAWRAVLDLDSNYNANRYNEKLSEDRRPWHAHPYATVIANEDEELTIRQPFSLPSTESERETISKQKSLDEMSMGSVDFINPDIVQQFKVVDQRLSEGFEQFRAVDQRLSDEFDKLEATLLKHGNATKSRTSDIGVEKKTPATISILEENISDSTIPPTSTGSDKASCSNPSTKISNYQQLNDRHDNSSIDDSEDDDDLQRRYQLPHLRSNFSKNRHQQGNTEATGPETLRSNKESPHVDQALAEERMVPKHAYVIPINPVSLLNLPESSNRNVASSIRSGEVETDDDDDDILSTSNNDSHDDEYCFQKIRSRFNSQH